MSRTKSRSKPKIKSLQQFWKDEQDRLNRRGKYAPGANKNNNSGKSDNSSTIQGPKNQSFFPFQSQAAKEANEKEVAAFKQKKKNNKSKGPNSSTNTKKISKTKAQIIKEYEAEKTRQKAIIGRKNPKLEKLRNKLGLNKDKSSSNTTVPDLVSKSKPKKEILTRKQQRIEARDNKKANRRVGRTAKHYVKGGGNLDNFDQKGSKQAELAKIQQRREGRNQFLRNFGSQIVRGTQAPSTEKFDDSGSGINYYNQNKEAAKSDKPITPTEIKHQADVDMNQYALDGIFQSDTDHDNNNMMGQLFGKAGNNPFTQQNQDSTLTTNVEEDSTPQSAMTALYKKKKGY